MAWSFRRRPRNQADRPDRHWSTLPPLRPVIDPAGSALLQPPPTPPSPLDRPTPNHRGIAGQVTGMVTVAAPSPPPTADGDLPEIPPRRLVPSADHVVDRV